MEKGNFVKNVTYEKFGTRDLVWKKDEAKKKNVLTVAKLPSLLQKCCQNNTWMLWCYIF